MILTRNPNIKVRCKILHSSQVVVVYTVNPSTQEV